ncbi:hypothetical protein KFS98_003561 [Salmonella enterica]|nr:hypothetical protein [Salmonella enterica]
MLYVSPTKGTGTDRDLLWYSLWSTRFKQLHGSCIEVQKPVWGMTPTHWTISGIQIRDVNCLINVNILFVDGRFGYRCVGFSFDEIICERKILNGKDLMNEIITYARERTSIDSMLKADSIESNLTEFLSRVMKLGPELTAFNMSVANPGLCHPVEVSYESNAMTSRIISEDLAKKGSRVINFKVTSDNFECLDGFYAYVRQYVIKKFYKLIPAALHKRFNFNFFIKKDTSYIVLTVNVTYH